MQICVCAWISRWTKNCGKSGLGHRAAEPRSPRAAGPPGRGGPWAAGRRAVGPSGRRAAGPWRAVGRGPLGRGPAFSKTRKKINLLHQKVLRTLYSMILHSEATETLDCIFAFYVKARSSNLSLLRVKTRPWKFLDLAANAPLAGERMQEAHKTTNQLWWSR